MKCCIFAGGDFFSVSLLEKAYVIAADSGYDNAIKNNITPDLLVGDMDSISGITVREDVEIITAPREKDDTDTALAIRLALQKGFSDIDIYCGTGSRLDHTFGNIQLLKLMHEKSVKATLYGKDQRIMLIKNERIALSKDYTLLSLLAFDAECVVSVSGVKYPLSSATITNQFPLGISNVIIEDTAEIISHSGYCLVIQTNDI